VTWQSLVEGFQQTTSSATIIVWCMLSWASSTGHWNVDLGLIFLPLTIHHPQPSPPGKISKPKPPLPPLAGYERLLITNIMGAFRVRWGTRTPPCEN
jgi:hypothetical protein